MRKLALACILALIATFASNSTSLANTLCSEGAYKYQQNGECCPSVPRNFGAVVEELQCVNDTWVHTGYWYCDGGYCPW